MWKICLYHCPTQPHTLAEMYNRTTKCFPYLWSPVLMCYNAIKVIFFCSSFSVSTNGKRSFSLQKVQGGTPDVWDRRKNPCSRWSEKRDLGFIQQRPQVAWCNRTWSPKGDRHWKVNMEMQYLMSGSAIKCFEDKVEKRGWWFTAIFKVNN